MQAGQVTANTTIRTFAVVASCFLLTSVGWLCWIYHLMDLAVESLDLFTMVFGYLAQAVGIGVYAATLRFRPGLEMRAPTLAAIAVYAAFLVPAATAADLTLSLALGYLCNIACGFIAGFYLHCLASLVPENRRGTVFGCGYALATTIAWPLSLLDGGQFLHSTHALLACGVLALVAFYAVGTVYRGKLASQAQGEAPAPPTGATPLPASRPLIVVACCAVLTMCLVKNMGNAFPAADLEAGLDLELSRLFYAGGLIIAGIVSDRNRLYGMVCCMAALAMPFITFSLSGMSVSAMMLWSLGYFLFGFFAVFRVVLFADLAANSDAQWLSGWGLMVGRIGDALGTAFCLGLAAQLPALVILSAVLFAVSVFLCFWLYHLAYAAAQPPQLSERQIFEAFAVHHDLSVREREVLRLVLDEKNNAEIAAELFVSESTVKFHVRNLLKKTGCKNRLEVLARYSSFQPR